MDKIFEIKLMKNRDTGEGKGFAFVAFKAKEVAQQAIEELHNKEFKGRSLRCSLSEAQHRLFIGNVPKTWTDDEFRKVIEVTGPGAAKTLSDLQNPSQNRGFAFVEYDNNACADYSRQKTSSANFKMDGNAPTVSWADPKNVPDNSAAVSQGGQCGTLIGSSKDEAPNQDVATSDAIKLAREVDPNGERTFGVLTKLDLMDWGTCITGHHGTILLGAEWGRDRTNALDVLEGRSYRLQHPWVGIVNRSQADINRNVDMLDARRREREFFATNPDYGHSASRMGSEYLAKLLSKQLESVIKLNHLGRTVAVDAGAQLYAILELCCAFDRIFKEHLDGWNKETNGFLKREVSPKTGSRVLCSNIKERKEEEVERTNSMKKGLFLVCEQVKQLFQRYGEVSKVVMPPAKSGGKRNFGFIHYAERSSALKAVKDAEKYEIDGQELEVCLAKPQSDKKFDWTNPYISGPHPNYIPHPGYGSFPGNPYGSLGGEYGVATGFQQVYCLIYGRGPVLERMHMIPMVRPDGRTGYVLSLEYRCRFNSLTKMIGATAQAELAV
ncbi:unnamed protein product [Camellia sinensis]